METIWTFKHIRTVTALIGLGFLSACGGGGDGNNGGNVGSTASGPGPGILTGIFSDAPVDGLTYVSTPSNYSGTTSTGGQFQYLPGDTVTFKVYGMGIGTGTAAPFMTPMDMTPDPLEANNNKVIKTLQLLQTLDTDKNPANGITIQSGSSLANKTLDTLDLTNPSDIALLGVNPADVVSRDKAATAFVAELDNQNKSGKAFHFVRLAKKLNLTLNGSPAKDVLLTRWATRKDAVEKAIQAKLDGLTKNSSDLTKHGLLPGITVKVTLPDGTPKTYVSGSYDMGKDTSILDGDEKPMTENKQFRIGSISKTFTGMTILQLVQEGKIDLNLAGNPNGPNLETYLLKPIPGVRNTPFVTNIDPNNLLTQSQLDKIKKLTLFQLIAHLSGIPQTSSQKMTDLQGNYDYSSWGLRGYLDPNLTGKYSFITGHKYTAWTPMDLVNISWGIGVQNPGSWMYSNINYVLLGMVIEAVTGTPWYTEVSNRFGSASGLALGIGFDPKTTPTTLPGGDDKGAVGYIDWFDNFNGACQNTPECNLNTKYSVIIHPSFYSSAGGVTASIADLYTWAGAIGKTYEGKSMAEGALLDPALGFSQPTSYFEIDPGILMMGPAVLKNLTYKLVGHPGQVQGYDCAVWYRYDVQEPITGCTNTTITANGKIQTTALAAIMALLDGTAEVK
ncbi:MAG: beta-lactamase family protein [Magnetococcus sp. YQC-5]